MTTILDLPQEVVEQILLELDPVDVAAISCTARSLFQWIYAPANQALWRQLYLAQPLDDLRICVTSLGGQLSDSNWKSRLQSIIQARNFVASASPRQGGASLPALRTLISVACEVAPLPDVDADALSLNHVWLYSLLRHSSFLDHEGFDIRDASEEYQMRARLHTYFGLTDSDFEERRLVQSRACVYALRNYREQNDYGPFLMDGSGRVNWAHLLAISHVVSMRIIPQPQSRASPRPILPLSLPFCQPVIPSNVDLDTVEDWAGVEGLWRCSFCFCDHRDLLFYNTYQAYPLSDTGALNTALFEDPEFEEAFGAVDMHCRVVSYEDDPQHPTRPVIHFKGGSEGQAMLRGWVKLTPDNQIRWHFISGQEENQVWSSEGIQIGSVRSTYGVLGAWTTASHDRGDPVGPFWLRKMPYHSDDMHTEVDHE